MQTKLFGIFVAAALTVGGALVLAPEASATSKNHSDILGVKKDGSLWLYENTGRTSAPFSGGSHRLGHGWTTYDNLFAADLNNDNRADLIGHDRYGQNTQVYPNTNGYYTGKTQYNGGYLSATVDAPGLAKSADTYAFGQIDAGTDWTNYMFIDSEGSLLMGGVQYGVGGNTFTGGSKKIGHGWHNFASIDLADVNNDGLDDLIGVTHSGGLYYYQNAARYNSQTTIAALNSSVFLPGKKIGHGWNTFDTVLVEDVNNDGFADIIGRKANGELRQYLNSKNMSRPYSSSTKIGHGWNTFDKLFLVNVR